MAYRRKPNYHFLSEMDVGISKVPIGRLIIVENFQGKIRCFIKISDWNLHEDSTIFESVLNGSLGEIPLKIGSEIEMDSGEKFSELHIADNNTLIIRET